MEAITILKAGPGEWAALQAISRETFRETFAEGNTEANLQQYLDTAFSTARLQEALNNPYSSFYFATVEGKIIGYLKLNFGRAQTELREDDGVEIERIYIDSAWQGRKAGKRLLQKALGIARERHAAYAWLGVWEQNLKAIAFYEKNGFTAFDRHAFELGGETQTDIMMKRELET